MKPRSFLNAWCDDWSGIPILIDLCVSAVGDTIGLPLVHEDGSNGIILGAAEDGLVGIGLACFVKPSAPAPFRPLAVLAGSALSLAVALFALIRAIVWLSYGHDYGVAAFVEALATIPVAVITAALGLGGAAPAA